MEDVEAEEDVQTVLTQETHELADILSYQDDGFLTRFYEMMDISSRQRLVQLASHRERILGLLNYFRTAEPAICRQFLQMVCMLCENMPMLLESRLMSVAGTVTSKYLCNVHVSANIDYPQYPHYSLVMHLWGRCQYESGQGFLSISMPQMLD